MALFLAGLVMAPDCRATTLVATQNFVFSPKRRTVALGDQVTWENISGTAHTATSDGVADGTGIPGLGLWTTGTVLGFSTNVAFNWAGRFNYHCTFHAISFGMLGVVKVPPTVSPLMGSTSTKFAITWAKVAPPSGVVFDIKIKRPGTPGFTRWTDPGGTTALSLPFTPDAGPGKYVFRARLRNPSSGATSGYSSRRITVS